MQYARKIIVFQGEFCSTFPPQKKTDPGPSRLGQTAVLDRNSNVNIRISLDKRSILDYKVLIIKNKA